MRFCYSINAFSLIKYGVIKNILCVHALCFISGKPFLRKPETKITWGVLTSEPLKIGLLKWKQLLFDRINNKVTSCLQNIALSWLHRKKVFLTRFLTTLCGWDAPVFLDVFSLNRNLAFFVH